MFSLLRIYLQRQFQQERGRFRPFAHTHLFFSGLAKTETFPHPKPQRSKGAFLPRLKDGGYLRPFSVYGWLNSELPNELGKDIYNNDGKEQAINTVEDAAVAGHKLPTVLDMRLALDERLRQVTERRGYSD